MPKITKKKGLEGMRYKKPQYSINRTGELSQKQLKNHEDFMKVRENETPEQWYKRTEHRRTRQANTKLKAELGLFSIEAYPYKQESELGIKTETIRYVLPSINFIKYIGFVKNFYVKRYGFVNSELELMFYLYDMGFFTKKEIEEANNLMLDRVPKVMITLSNRKIISEKLFENGEKSGLFQLNSNIKRIVSKFYIDLLFFSDIKEFNKSKKTVMHGPDYKKTIQEKINEMTRQIIDIEENNGERKLLFL
jgi:hypothetical protein